MFSPCFSNVEHVVRPFQLHLPDDPRAGETKFSGFYDAIPKFQIWQFYYSFLCVDLCTSRSKNSLNLNCCIVVLVKTKIVWTVRSLELCFLRTIINSLSSCVTILFSASFNIFPRAHKTDHFENMWKISKKFERIVYKFFYELFSFHKCLGLTCGSPISSLPAPVRDLWEKIQWHSLLL